MRALQWVTLLVGLAGVLLSLLPTSAFSPASCPWLARDSTLGAALAAAATTWASVSGRAMAATGGGGGAAGTRVYTRAELAAYDGSDPAAPLLLGMGGDVFDVTAKGAQFYGKGAGYNLFAGRDSTRALALGSLDPADIANWRTDDFTPAQAAALAEQHKFYVDKYGPRVGVLAEGEVPVPLAPPAASPATAEAAPVVAATAAEAAGAEAGAEATVDAVPAGGAV